MGGSRLSQAASRRRRPGVFSLVDAEGMSPDEIFATPLTFKRFLFRVDSLMIHKAVISIIRFLTEVTFVALLSAVNSLVI